MATHKTTRIIHILSALILVTVSSGAAFAGVHKVEKGETYYSISRKYGISVDALCAANSLTTSDVLKAGQSLTIPDASSGKTADKPDASAASSASSSESATGAASSSNRKYDTYTVQKGDTFYRIAKVNGISVDELKSLNDLSADSVLMAGVRLKIPATIVDTATASLPSLPESDPRKYKETKGDSSLVWPVKNPVVTYTSGKVSGVQLSAEKDEDVTAIRAGTVVYVGNYRGYGQVVFVQSKTEQIYVYSGLGSIKVQKGDYVVFGDSIGTAGTDSIKGTNQICLMVFDKARPTDPAKAPRG